jgi:hypothetical protein
MPLPNSPHCGKPPLTDIVCPWHNFCRVGKEEGPGIYQASYLLVMSCFSCLKYFNYGVNGNDLKFGLVEFGLVRVCLGFVFGLERGNLIGVAGSFLWYFTVRSETRPYQIWFGFSIASLTLSKIIRSDWLKYSAADQKKRPLCKNNIFSHVLSKLDQFLNHFRAKICEKSSFLIHS